MKLAWIPLLGIVSCEFNMINFIRKPGHAIQGVKRSETKVSFIDDHIILVNPTPVQQPNVVRVTQTVVVYK